MNDLLPTGTIVRVTESGPDGRTYVGRVVGYDLGRSKYEIGLRFGGSRRMAVPRRRLVGVPERGPAVPGRRGRALMYRENRFVLGLLRPMLDAYPQVPAGFDGWWTFRDPRTGGVTR